MTLITAHANTDAHARVSFYSVKAICYVRTLFFSTVDELTKPTKSVNKMFVSMFLTMEAAILDTNGVVTTITTNCIISNNLGYLWTLTFFNAKKTKIDKTVVWSLAVRGFSNWGLSSEHNPSKT